MSDDCQISYFAAYWDLKKHGQALQGLGESDTADPREDRDHGGES